MLVIPTHLSNLLSTTSDAYNKTLRLKAYSDTLKKHISNILDYAKVKFFNLSMHWTTPEHWSYQ